MSARQNGQPMYKIIEIVNNGNFTQPISSLMNAIIKQAYETSRYSSEDFKNEIFLSCYKLIDKP